MARIIGLRYWGTICHENNNWIINKYDFLFSKLITHSKAVA